MSDSQTNDTTPKQTTWQDIVADLLILIAIMGVIGFGLKIAMDSCKVETPTEALCAVIRKGDVDDASNKDKVFLKELASGQSKHADFVNMKDNTGRTPLMWASYANSINPEEVASIDMLRLYYVRELLATPGVDAKAADKDGFTALHWACWSGLDGVALELIARGGLNINQQESHGYTPLMLAAMRGNAPTVKMLLQLGANTATTNAQGETAAQLAASHHAAYVANESGLYKTVTNTKGAFFYFPIYKEARSDSFAESAALLAAPPAAAGMDSLLAELAARESAAKTNRMKAKEEAAAQKK